MHTATHTATMTPRHKFSKVEMIYLVLYRTWLKFFPATFLLLRADLHDTILSHATGSRQAYERTYDCRSVLKHVLKCYDIFSDVHNNRKSCAKGTNGNLAITRPLGTINQKRTNHIDLHGCKNINQSEPEGQILTLASA